MDDLRSYVIQLRAKRSCEIKHPHARLCFTVQYEEQAETENQFQIWLPHMQVGSLQARDPSSTRPQPADTDPRIRKVKCDEGQPACERCTSTGRVCDGYGIWGGGKPFRTPTRSTCRPFIPTQHLTPTHPLLLRIRPSRRRLLRLVQVSGISQAAGELPFWLLGHPHLSDLSW